MQREKTPNKGKRYLKTYGFMPWQFHLLCKLTGKEPEKVLYDFMCNVGMEGYGLGEVQRAKAMEYFLSCGYGQDYYTEEDIRKILKEMESISGLFPTNSGKMKLIDLHAKWRNKYYKYWYRKWFFKVRRRI